MGLPTVSVGDKWTADVVATLPANVIYYGFRTTVSSTTSGTTELPVLRIDNMVLKAGRQYLAVCHGTRPTLTVVTDHFKMVLKYSSTGTATTATAELARVEMTMASTSNYPPILGWISPSVDTAVGSILMTVVRTAGTGTFVTNADTSNTPWIAIVDMGIAVTNTGVSL